MNSSENEAFEKCICFLKEIGIDVQFKALNPTTILPGFEVEKGILNINLNAVTFPGDILHEAGHIAVVPAAERETLNNETIGQRENREAEEMMAIAWSYAACCHLQINTEFVFHEAGYKGGGNYIVEAYSKKQYFGLPMLQWVGLAADETRAKELNILPFPHMIKWMRD